MLAYFLQMKSINQLADWLINSSALRRTPRIWNFIFFLSVWVRSFTAWHWQHCTVRKYHSD